MLTQSPTRYTLPEDVDEAELDLEFSRFCIVGHVESFRKPKSDQNPFLPFPPTKFPTVTGLKLKPRRFERSVPRSKALQSDMLRICYEHQCNKIYKEWDRARKSCEALSLWSWLRLRNAGWIREAEATNYISDHELSTASVVSMAIIDLVDLVTNSVHGTYGKGLSNSSRYAQVQLMMQYAAERQSFVDVLEELYNATESSSALQYQKLPAQLTKTMGAQIVRREIEMKAQEERVRAEEEKLARKKVEEELAQNNHRKIEGRSVVRKLYVGSVQTWLDARDVTEADPAYDRGFIKELLSIAEDSQHFHWQLEQKVSVVAALTTRLEEIETMAASPLW
jgi:hypothetical protein